MDLPIRLLAPAGHVSEDAAATPGAAGPSTAPANTGTSNNPATTPGNTTSRGNHLCNADENCTFTSETAKGIREHQKNKHLGLECYWLQPDNEFCGYTTLTHEELYEHFNQEHLRGGVQPSGPPYQCRWPGCPGIPIPGGGPSVPPENRCEQTFQHVSSADRHAREHQHKIWRAMDSVKWPPKQE
ncbi:hypothetical protein F4803DRAFT_571204 [Xylaria telfairii]|nr:hypothetical protein F4803DRAFT_571204 [Xylaria telfairii]